MKTKFAITIGRQFGSKGKEIANELGKQMNIPCYDKELINLASKESGIGKELFEQADEKKPFNIFSGFLDLNSTFVGEGYYVNNYFDDETLFRVQSEVIRKLAEKESCIFVGRCADYILKEHPCCISIFISANQKDRIELIMKREQLPEDKAKKVLERMDKKRANYYNYYTNKVWGSATSYNLCINSSMLGIHETTSCIQSFIEKILEK